MASLPTGLRPGPCPLGFQAQPARCPREAVSGRGGYSPEMGTISVALPYDDRWFFTEALAGAVDRILGEGHEPIVHVVPPSPDAADEVAAAVQQDLTARASLGAVAVGFRLHQEHQERFAALQRPVGAARPGSPRY
jgi:hypothetical protein